MFPNGTIGEADAMISTVPLGVMKRGSSPTFKPTLPKAKLEAMQGLSMGVTNKVVVSFKTCFWETDKEILGFQGESGNAFF